MVFWEMSYLDAKRLIIPIRPAIERFPEPITVGHRTAQISPEYIEERFIIDGAPDFQLSSDISEKRETRQISTTVRRTTPTKKHSESNAKTATDSSFRINSVFVLTMVGLHPIDKRRHIMVFCNDWIHP